MRKWAAARRKWKRAVRRPREPGAETVTSIGPRPRRRARGVRLDGAASGGAGPGPACGISRGPRLLLGEQSGRGKAAKFRGAARPRQATRRGPRRRVGWAGAGWGPRPSRRVSGTRGVAALGLAPSNRSASAGGLKPAAHGLKPVPRFPRMPQPRPRRPLPAAASTSTFAGRHPRAGRRSRRRTAALAKTIPRPASSSTSDVGSGADVPVGAAMESDPEEAEPPSSPKY